MTVAGIVAEFNPFHNGHGLLIETVRRKLHPKAIICVMSGPFMQRGEPALCDKWARTRMALAQGVDIVFELPFCYATRSAYYFARGALLTLHAAGATHLVFGSESGELGHLIKVAAVLSHELPSYREVLQKELSRGLSFPAARAAAVESVLDDDSPEIKQLLSEPNNILGIEYLRIVHELDLPLKPFTIKRHGAGYHGKEASELASATGIRNAIHLGNSHQASLALPRSSLAVLQAEIEAGRAPIPVDSLEAAILTGLRLACPAWLSEINEVSEGLENRILSAAQQNGTLPELRKAIKSRRYSLTRVNRILLHSLFAVSKNQIACFDRVGPQYLHLLGFSSQGRKILQKLRNNSNLPVLNTGRRIAEFIGKPPCEAGLQMLSLDIKAQDVFNLLKPNPRQRQAGQDYRQQVIKG